MLRIVWALSAASIVMVQGCGPGVPRPPDAATAQLPEDQFVEVNAVRLHYLDWGGSGDPLLFIPGLTATAHHFADLAPLLTDEFRVVALTRRGHGASEKPGIGYDLETLSADVEAFLDHLGPAKVVLAAHSFGSLEAVEVASRNPDQVRALVLLDAAYDWPAWLSESAHLSAVDPPDRVFRSLAGLESWYREVQAPTWGPARRASLRAQFREGPDGSLVPRLPEDAMAAMVNVARAWTPESYAELKVPTLIVWANQREWERTLERIGEPDSVIAAQRSWRELHDIPSKMIAISSLEATVDSVVVVEIDAVHELHLQRPAEVAAAMLEFLRSGVP